MLYNSHLCELIQTQHHFLWIPEIFFEEPFHRLVLWAAVCLHREKGGESGVKEIPFETGEKFHANTGQCRCDLGMAFFSELACRVSNWTKLHEKFRIVIDYDPDGVTNVEIKSLIDHDANHQ